jgi:enoyl-[acyl-carrier-protein] reductase (NADH)
MGLTYQDLYNNTAAKMALRRLVTPEEVAAATVFFASDESSGITGEVLHVNAGLLLNVM